MQFGDPSVVSSEEGQEIVGQIVFVKVRQGADDAEVQGDVVSKMGPSISNQDVAGMHIGVEKTITEDLGEENFDPFGRQLFERDAF